MLMIKRAVLLENSFCLSSTARFRRYATSAHGEQQQPVVGMIGLGNMGAGMALNLVQKGLPIVAYDYDTVRAERLKQKLKEEGPASSSEMVTCAYSPCEVAQSSDIILLSIANQNATQEVIFGDKGILEGQENQHVKVVADLGTVSLGFSQRCHRAFRKFNIGFLDAPVSGGPEGSLAGTLSVMVGGSIDDFDRALPAFEAIGTNVVHLGKEGTGTITKMINQMLVGAHITAAAEAYVMAKGLGLGTEDIEKLRSVLDNSWAQSRMLKRSMDLLLEGDKSGNYEQLLDSAAPIRNLAKDFAIIETAAANNNLDLPSMELVGSIFSKAAATGLQEADLCMIKELYEDKKVV